MLLWNKWKLLLQDTCMDSNYSTKCCPFVVCFKALREHRFFTSDICFQIWVKGRYKELRVGLLSRIRQRLGIQGPGANLGAHNQQQTSSWGPWKPTSAGRQTGQHVCADGKPRVLPAQSSAPYQSGRGPEVKYVASFRKESEQWPLIWNHNRNLGRGGASLPRWNMAWVSVLMSLLSCLREIFPVIAIYCLLILVNPMC